MRIVKIGAFFVVLTGAAAMLAGCANHPTAAKKADSLKADIVCRSGYVVTSGRDSVYTGCQPQ